MKPNYHIHEDIYIQIKNSEQHGWGGNNRLANAKLVQRFFKIKHKITIGNLLELGCGEGHHCRTFATHGFEVTGVDISQTAIAWAEEKASSTGIKGTFLVADLTLPHLKLPGKYQVIVDGNCFHCIIGEDRITFLNNVYHALESSGTLFISSLCSKDDSNYLIHKYSMPYRHITSKKSLVSELEVAGFEVLEINIYERERENHITIHALKVG